MSGVAFLLGAAILAALLRCWRRELSWRLAGSYTALVALLLSPVLFFGRHMVPTDIAYQWQPWRGLVGETVQPQNPLLGDSVLQMLPFRELVRERLLRFEAPLWASEIGTGQPLLANGQSAPFAPLNLLALPLAGLAALSVIAAWKMLVALWLTHLLLLRLRASPGAAALGALCFGLSPFTVVWLSHPHSAVSAWLPGVLLGLIALGGGEAERRPAFWGLVGCGLGAALGGHPETLAHLGVVAIALAALRWWTAPARLRPLFLRRTLLAALLVGLLSAPALLPLVEAIPRSQRSAALEIQPTGAQPPPLEAATVAMLVQPEIHGNPRDHSWSGVSNFNEVAPVYTGLLPLALAFAAVAAGQRRWRWTLLGGGLALAVAVRVPGLWDAWFRLPVLGHGANGRLRMVWVMAVAVAAALALDRLASDARLRRIFFAGAVLVFAAGLMLAPAGQGAWAWARWSAALASLPVAVCALLVERWRPRVAWICAVGLAMELAVLAARYQPAVPAALDLEPGTAVRALAVRPGESPWRVVAFGYTLAPDLGALWGLWDPRGNDPMRPAAAAELLSLRLGHSPLPGQHIGLRGPDDQALLDVLGVRYALVRSRSQLPAPWLRRDSDGQLTAWENPDARAVFYVTPRVRWLVRANDCMAQAKVEDLRRTTIRMAAALAPEEQAGDVEGIVAGANSFSMRTRSPGAALVASSVSFDPGWRLEIDGRSQPVETVNAAFLGFEVPGGEHSVRLVYRPGSWVLGCWLFACGLALAAALAFAQGVGYAASRRSA